MVGLATLKEFAAARAHVRASPSESARPRSAEDVLEASRSGIRAAPARAPVKLPAVRCERSRARTLPDVRTFGLPRDRDDPDQRRSHAEGRAPPPPVDCAEASIRLRDVRDARRERVLAAVCQDLRRPRLQGSRAELSHDARKVPAVRRSGAVSPRYLQRSRGGRAKTIVSRGRARARLEQLRELDGAPFVMVVNFQVPGTPPVSMCAYWGVPRPAPSGEDPECAAARGLFERFIDIPENGDLGAEAFNNQRFKLIPRIDEGPFVIRRAVGSKPTLLGQKVRQRYFRGPDTELDIDVSSSAIATHIVSLCRGGAPS